MFRTCFTPHLRGERHIEIKRPVMGRGAAQSTISWRFPAGANTRFASCAHWNDFACDPTVEEHSIIAIGLPLTGPARPVESIVNPPPICHRRALQPFDVFDAIAA